ncbi:hypothetical protein CDN97_11255 [Pantoea sp. AMG 501]|nr:hypothetical protein CDN97_11255 [Pantoea sp. AMG 501]
MAYGSPARLMLLSEMKREGCGDVRQPIQGCAPVTLRRCHERNSAPTMSEPHKPRKRAQKKRP